MLIPPWPQATEREAELLASVLDAPQWGGFHPFISDLERSFSAYQHCAEGIAAANGTLTLEVALTALGVAPGDEVIVPAISFVSSATAVSRLGAVPVFVDIEPYSFNLDPAKARAAVTSKTKVVIAVHFGGTPCALDELLALCSEAGVALLEDAAHAHGSEWRGRRLGSFGVAGSFSFQNGKVLCAGEGGMLTTSDSDFAALARSLVNQGREARRSFYEHWRLGTNARMTAFQAAVLLAQFERLPAQIARRKRNAQRLQEQLADLTELQWQPQPAECTQNSYYLLPGRLDSRSVSRNQFCSALSAAGVPNTPFYPHALYDNPLYRSRDNCRVAPCPQTEACLADAFWLPHRVLLSDEATIDAVALCIRTILRP